MQFDFKVRSRRKWTIDIILGSAGDAAITRIRVLLAIYKHVRVCVVEIHAYKYVNCSTDSWQRCGEQRSSVGVPVVSRPGARDPVPGDVSGGGGRLPEQPDRDVAAGDDERVA